ncbi:Ig-like domain-containing protein, partial [Methanobrevibacter sp.]|uniref:Ig-like domain-containing protein n=1 Tax=Methanobrevibacter sp. TaxID=66852 RepID=UPI002E763324
MKCRYLIVSFLIISIFLSINMVVATDVDLNNMSATLNSENSLNCIDVESSQLSDNVLAENNEEFNVESSDNEELLSDEYVVDVKTTDGVVGDLSEDPINMKIEEINEEEVESVTMNIHNGTYVMFPSNFNYFYYVNNLIINGVDGKVILEPFRSPTGTSTDAAFGFENSANVIFNNITFDLSKLSSDKYLTPAEMPDAEDGSDLYVTLNNCTFIGGASNSLDTIYANTKYINCIFINFTGDYLFKVLSTDTYTYFENCVFSNVDVNLIGPAGYSARNDINLTFNGVWFGNNTIALTITNYPSVVSTPGFVLPIQKYALFSVSKSDLSDNQYEIVGKLTWNGTNSSEGMENFPPMTVTLTSTTGSIQDAILTNGIFKANYTSSASEHKVIAKLGSEEIDLTFQSKVKDYTFDISEIADVKVGDTKEVIITLPNDATGEIVISIGDNNFNGTVEGNTTKVNIKGFVLGENIINITYSGNDRYESSTKNITVSAVKETTTITTTNVTATYNVAKNLVITLTANGGVLANKTINIVVGTINENLTTDDRGQVSVNIATLAPNTYVANIAFAGDDLYDKSNATANVVVNKLASSLTAPKVTATYNVAKNLVITLTANGKPLEGQKVTVKVGTISKTLTTNVRGQVSVDVSKLTPKTYKGTITYAGDSINDKSTNTAKVVVNKATPKLTAKKATFKAKTKTKKYTIVLKDNKGKAIKKAKVTLKVKGKTYKATTNAKGKATFKITKLTKKGKNTATIKFGGN